MTEEELCLLSISELAPRIASRELSPVELVRATLDRTHRLEPSLHAYITVTSELAMDAARRAEGEIARGEYRGPLHGVPVSLKDIVYLKGVLNTAASRTMAGFVPAYDATVTARLLSAGAVMVGKTQLYEFAMGPKSYYEEDYTRNPWDLNRLPGGSSSGSAAGVAAGLAHASIGSDTGGSVRGPAAICGVVGLKPTYGLVSRYGVVPQSWTMDHVGPLTRTVADAALVMNAIAGYDPEDPGSVDAPVPDFTRALTGDIRGLKIGICDDFYPGGVQPELGAAFQTALGVLESAGATVQRFSFPFVRFAPSLYSTIVLPENASIQEERIRSSAGLFTMDARNKTELGSFLLATDYLKAQRVRTVFRQEFAAAVSGIEVIALPMWAGPPATFDEVAPRAPLGKGALVESDRARRTFNLLGAPAISVPCGFTSQGLPIGLQIAARPLQDQLVLRAAHAYEQRTTWHRRHPSLV